MNASEQPPLAQLLAEFRRHLLDQPSDIQTHIVDAGSVDAAGRLSVYANAYRSRLLEALDANYPELHKWLGDEEFRRIGQAYIEQHPSQHYSIRWFGHRLSEFLRATVPWNEEYSMQALADFEWATSEVFDAANADVVAIDHIASLPPPTWPTMRMQFHPSLRRRQLTWNAPPIWRALTRNETPDEPSETESPITWIVWRQAFAIYYRSLDVDESWALDAALNGANFAELCEGLCEWIDAEHVAARAAGFLRQWVQDGLITRVDA